MPKCFETRSRTLILAAQSALGLLAISFGMFAWMEYRKPGSHAFPVFVVIGTLLSIPALFNGLTLVRRNVKETFFALMSGGGYFLPLLFFAMLPASKVDELVYHLAIPKNILREGRWMWQPDNIYAYFPQSLEMLFTLGMGLLGESGARSIQMVFGGVLALAVYGACRKYVSGFYAFLSVLLVMSVPAMVVFQPAAYVDIAYMLYSFLGFLALKDCAATGSRKCILIAGGMAGAAFCVKYTGLQLAVIFLIFYLFFSDKKKPGILLFNLFLFSAIFCLVASPWLLRNFRDTGWPLYPFYVPGFFLKEGMNWDPDRARFFLTWLGQFGAPTGDFSIRHALAAPFWVFIRGRFDSIQYYDGVLGPVFLLTPLAVWHLRKELWARQMAGFLLLFIYYWAFSTRQVRFLFPAIPFAAILMAASAAKIQKKWLNAILILYTAGSFAFGLYHLWDKLKPWNYSQGTESRKEYLSRQYRNYRIYQKTSRLLWARDKVYLLHMKNYTYWLDSHWTADYILERWRLDRLLEQTDKPDEIAAYFKNLKVTHLMIDEGFLTSREWGLEGKAMEAFRFFIQGHAKLVFRDGPYALYQLK